MVITRDKSVTAVFLLLCNFFLYNNTTARVYHPNKYGGYRTPVYGYQERDSSYRILHSSFEIRSEPWCGFFEISSNGLEVEEYNFYGDIAPVKSTEQGMAAYDCVRGKLIAQLDGNLAQYDMIHNKLDWNVPGSGGLQNIFITNKGNIVGYASASSTILPILKSDIAIFDTIGNLVKTIHLSDSNILINKKFLQFDATHFIGVGNKINPTDTLNGVYTHICLFDSSFNIEKRIDVPEIVNLNDVILTNDKKLIVISSPISRVNRAIDFPELIEWWHGWHLLSMIDTNGVVLRTDTMSSYSTTTSIANNLIRELADGNLLYVCQEPKNKNWLNFLKLSSTGKLLGIDSIGFNHIASIGLPSPQFTKVCFPVSMEKTIDNGYYLVWKNKVPTFQAENNFGCWAMKFDSLGNFYWPNETGVQGLQSVAHRVYPNPANAEINFELTEVGKYELTFTDINGKDIYTGAVQGNATINSTSWSNGVYFYTLSNNQKVTKGKVVKY